MFRGIAALNIDAKGRITVPAQHRKVIMEEAKNQLVLTIDTEERCLLVYPFPHWQTIEEKLEQLPSFHPVARRIQRLLIGHAMETELDRQGRILLPPLLRDYAGLDKVAMLVGQGRKFELWGRAQWQTSRDSWLEEGMRGNPEIPPEILSISL